MLVVLTFAYVQMFLSAMIDVAGHAGLVDVAFQILQEARVQGLELGIIPYSSLMGACSNVCLVYSLVTSSSFGTCKQYNS